MLSEIDDLAGMSPWLLMDYRCPRRQLPGAQDYYNRKGFLSNKGEKKQTFLRSEMKGEPSEAQSVRSPSEPQPSPVLRSGRVKAKPVRSPPRCRVHCSDSSPNPGCTAKSEARPKPSKVKSPVVWLAFCLRPENPVLLKDTRYRGGLLTSTPIRNRNAPKSNQVRAVGRELGKVRKRSDQHKSCICLVISSSGNWRYTGNGGNSGSGSPTGKDESAEGSFIGTTGGGAVGPSGP
jgi:hypothetical protein